ELQEKVFKSLKPGDFMPPQSAYNLLKFYGFQCADIVYRKSLTSLLAKRDKVTGPWVLRVHHEEYMYPFAYGKNPRDRIRSVVRNLNSKEEIVAGAAALEHLIAERFPDSSIMGYTLQTMHRALDNLQFSFGIGRDPEIGPFLFFGGGGTTADILVDRQVALPPLNANLAEQLIRRSHFYEVLLERSEDPQRDLLTLEHWLIALSHIALNHPTLAGLEVNAIRQKIGSYLVIGLAAEIGKPMRCAILPYPNELEGRYVSRSNTTYLVRPIRGEDEPALNLFYKNLSAESLRMRFFSSRRYFDHRELARLTQIDYDREMAFIAYNGAVMKGVVRVWIDPDNVAAEFSVIIDDLLRGEGLGRHLMERIIDYLKNRGVIQIYGSVLPENKPMLALAERLGFAAKLNREDGVMEIAKTLNRQRHKWQGKRMFSV
ncbi:MAG: GNAT family N-acetyltransferase, partial [Oleibacter sp.]|nr:GNAT family N-acetyltransferase [Thalassolituus sp.]